MKMGDKGEEKKWENDKDGRRGKRKKGRRKVLREKERRGRSTIGERGGGREKIVEEKG